MATMHEILLCYQNNQSFNQTVTDKGCARGTVRRYVRWANSKGYLDGGAIPDEDALALAWKADNKGRRVVNTATDALEPLRGIITEFIESDINLARINDLLVERHGWSGNYEALKRFTRPMRERRDVCIRLEVDPGEEAQVDFGYAGYIWDDGEKRKRKAWLFLMTLSHSRHIYGELVFKQDLPTWIGCHRRAFESFGGVPKKVVMDNLKAAIIKAAIYDPLVNRTYREFALHYGFIISPCVPRTPEHKGKVERGVPYVRGAVIKGADFKNIDDGNERLKVWNMTKAGLRIHGTTRRQPLVVFDTVEKASLKALPETPYQLCAWFKGELRRDCHVTADKCRYSAPHILRGEELYIRVGEAVVHIFHDHKLVATHLRASHPGDRVTKSEHYPPQKLAYLEHTPQWCLTRAKKIGANTFEFIDRMFKIRHPLDTLKGVQGVLRFADKYAEARVEAACKRALHFGASDYRSIKNILEKNLDGESLVQDESAATKVERVYEFARPVEEFLQLNPQEDTLWN